MPSDHSESRAFARIAQALLAEPSMEPTLQKIAELAVSTVPGCDLASVTLRRRGRLLETPASTSDLATELDTLQYDLGEGPCLDAVWDEDQCVIEDMRTEVRWPRWAPLAADRGIRSALSVRMATSRDVVGVLNLYSTSLQAYDQDAIVRAHIYGTHASAAFTAANHITGLTSALQTRHRIGLAQGLLMARYGLTEQKAFEFLTRRSQDANVKLRDIASQVISELARGRADGSTGTADGDWG